MWPEVVKEEFETGSFEKKASINNSLLPVKKKQNDEFSRQSQQTT